MTHVSSYLRHLFRDFLIIAGSIVVAFLLARAGVIQNFIEATGDSVFISSLIAGAFFTFIFTLAPAAVALLALGDSASPLLVASLAALGATSVDLIVASFIRKDISRDIDGLAKITLQGHFIRAFHFGFLKWVTFTVGVFLVATPLPDELGLFLIGISRIQTWALPFIFYTAHFIGIYLLLTIASIF